MADTIEEKWPKGFVGSIIFLCVLILMLATVAPNNLIDKVMQKEREWSVAMLSTSDMETIIGQTNKLYTLLVIDSGLKSEAAQMFLARGESSVDAFEEKVGWWFTYLEDRGAALQKIIYQIVYRVVLAIHWLPFMLVTLVPSVFSGWMRWCAKRYGFDYASQVVNNHAVVFIVWGLIAVPVSLLLPLPLPPLVVATGLIALMPIIISLLISNLPKRL
ncbi:MULTISPECIES: DUF4400 domain-containing protein [Pseudomonas]|jgi:hypothetical protein|uniref:DUF4400 domain-containing protein n=1 Tax=Pseudomonas sp. FSL W5-0299 TaxID=1917484 RepID=UPI0008544B16|nr:MULTISPECIES: DUF4400 domain-containing protein [Pseudomonas]OEO25094.1 hypothetical protein AX279_13475 [Pseudomonas sp. J237]OOL35442.1 hypothetical protein BOO94_23685 [Pseudomonas sp. FSL W5-0299]